VLSSAVKFLVTTRSRLIEVMEQSKKFFHQAFLPPIHSYSSPFHTPLILSELSERQQKLGQHLSALTRLAEDMNIAVFLVNQCTADPGAMSLFAPVVKPVGGNVLAHASCTRIHLKKGRENCRVAKVVDSPSMPEAEAQFAITDGGIADE